MTSLICCLQVEISANCGLEPEVNKDGFKGSNIYILVMKRLDEVIERFAKSNQSIGRPIVALKAARKRAAEPTVPPRLRQQKRRQQGLMIGRVYSLQTEAQMHFAIVMQVHQWI